MCPFPTSMSSNSLTMHPTAPCEHMKRLLEFAKFTPDMIRRLYQGMGDYAIDQKDGKQIRLKMLSIIENTEVAWIVLDATDINELLLTIHSGRGDDIFLAYSNAMLARATMSPERRCDSCAIRSASTRLVGANTSTRNLREIICSRTDLMEKTYRRQSSVSMSEWENMYAHESFDLQRRANGHLVLGHLGLHCGRSS